MKRAIAVSVLVAAALLLAVLLRDRLTEPERSTADLQVARREGHSAQGTAAKGPLPTASATASLRPIDAGARALDAGTKIGGNPALFGSVVALRNSFALGEALSKNAAAADAYVDKLCDEASKLREKPALREPSRHERERFALALRRGDLPAASAEVRHLADLIRSQQLLISELVAILIYKNDARARAVAASAGADLSGWDALDVDQLDRQRSATFASMYFTYPGVDAETVKKAADCMPSPCSALIEGASANRSFGSFGTADNLQLVRELSAARGCEPALLDLVVGARELPAGEAVEMAAKDLDGQIAKYLGGAR